MPAQEFRMASRSVLSMCLLAVVGLASLGCTSGTTGNRSPNAPSPEQNAGSSDGATRPPQQPRPDPPPLRGTCVADLARWAVGQRASATLLERARIASTASVARFIRPNEAITMEYSPARLNLYVNAREIVEGVVCG
jgi:hypothetical protein